MDQPLINSSLPFPRGNDGALAAARRLLCLEPRDVGILLNMLAEGFPVVSLDHFLGNSGMAVADAASNLRLSPAQLKARRRAGRLEPDESERLLRLAGFYAHAFHLLEDAATAVRWLSTTARGLGGRIPLNHARTEWGASEVHDLIGRIDDGVFS